MTSTWKCLAICVLLSAAWMQGAESDSPPVVITVDPGIRFQTIDGFGLNFTAPYFRDDQKAMFDTFIDDLGVTLFRVVPYLIYSDWEVTNDNDDPEMMNWEYYNDRYSTPIFEASWKAIRYLNSRGIQPEIALMGPVPSWMLSEVGTKPRHVVCNTDSSMPPLNPAMYGEFAEEVVSLVMYARSKEKLSFQYFSPFNETDCYPAEGPRIDPQDAPAVLAAVAKRLRKEGLGDVKLEVADQANIETDYTTPILANADVMKQVGAFAFHTYGDGPIGPQVERVRASKYPATPVWLTEYGDLNDQDKSAENDWKKFSLSANRIALLALNQGANAVFYFNAFDDYEECARRLTFYGLFHSADHVYYPKKRYYATRQLYHFVRPGDHRVAAEVSDKRLTVSAFQSPSGSTVVVGVKDGGSNHIRVQLPAKAADRWDLYLTTRALNCERQPPVTAHGGIAEFDLPNEAIFTLVSSFAH